MDEIIVNLQKGEPKVNPTLADELSADALRDRTFYLNGTQIGVGRLQKIRVTIAENYGLVEKTWSSIKK